jgi:2-desacetyl-2-hydroxyethyl bacteriochlorophyllide A dehydrogenase
LPTDAPRARELWFTGPRAVEVRDGQPPHAGPGQVLVRALASGISQGTELLLFRGEGPTPFDPSLDAPGATTYPRRYGYAWVGEVIARGAPLSGADAPEIGTRVFALAPHGDLHALEAAAALPIPPAIPASRAVLAANLETAVTCVWDSGASIGDEVVVLGGGVVGLLTTWLAARVGASVRLVEPSARRRALGLALGAAAAVAPDEDESRAEADVVFEATGAPAALASAIAHAATEAVIVVVSFYGARTAPVPLGGEFHRRRITLRASQVSAVPPARARRWTLARRFDLVRRLLEDSVLDLLLDTPVPFGDAPRAYARLDATPGDGAQTMLVYP